MAQNTMWDVRYSEEGFAYGTSPNDFLRENLSKLPPGGKVLCLAEGEGRNAVFLAANGFDVTAVDSSVVGLEKARKLAQENGVEITTIVVDLADFEFRANEFDAVVSIFCHLPPPIRKRVSEQIPRCLKDGGVLLLEGYTPDQLTYGTGGPPSKELMVTIELLEDELSTLNIIHAKELVREINEGRLHTGAGAVAQLIAMKKQG